jgi:hypothetical protein
MNKWFIASKPNLNFDKTKFIQFAVFWVVMPRGAAVGYQCCGGPYCLHFHHPADKGSSKVL